MSALRAGLVGMGAMGRNHCRVLSGLPEVDLVGVADPALAGTTVADGVPVVETVAELLDLGLDYLTIACPTGLHEEVGLAAAEAGVAAFIEKPVAHSVEAANTLVEAFGSRGLTAGVAHIERFNPALQQMRSRLSAGELGEIYQVVTRRQGPFPARIADVGVVMDLATHDIDLTSWITGRPFRSVAAHTTRRSGRAHEDMVAVVGALEGGVISSHLVNWLSPFKERCTVVTGERGCFIADTLTADLTFYANGQVTTEWEGLRNFRGVSEGDMTRFAIAKREPLLVEHETFRDALLGREADIVTLDQGLRIVEVAAAILESSVSGATVTLS